MPRVGLAVCLAAIAALAPPSRAQAPPTASDAAWSSLELPGGTAGLLSAAGLDPARPRATALLDVIRVVHEVREGLVPPLDARRLSLASYLDALNAFLAARAPLPPGPLTSAAAANGNTRNLLKALASAMGLSLEQRDRAYTLQLTSAKTDDQRRNALKLAGLDPASVVVDFNAGRPVRLELRTDLVPLPLPVAAWRALPGMASTWLARSILADQRASWMYYGLCGTDEETRRYIAAHPELLARVHDSDRAAVMPLHVGSLHVRGGRVQPPGGEAAAPLWERVAGAPLSDPARFMLAVLGKARLAHLYDAVDRMDAPARVFTLGLWIADPAQRLERFKALNDRLGEGIGVWDPINRPFTRNVYDPGHVLLASPVRPDGRPGALGWVAFWQKAFEGETLPAQPIEDLKDVERDGPLDAASLVRLLSAASGKTRRELSEAWCFGQRLFAAVPQDKMGDALVVLRGYSRYGPVSLTLERLGIVDPSVHAAAVSRAEQISRIGHQDGANLALALHQGAFVLIERARLARVLDAATATRLVAALNRLPLADGEFAGSVSAWIDGEYLPAIGARNAKDADAVVLAAFAGRRQNVPPPDRKAEYEGTRYQVDPSHAELTRLNAIRDKQGGATLQAVLVLAREARQLPDNLATVAQLPERIARLRASAEAVEQAQPRASSGWTRPADLGAVMREALANLSAIRKTPDLKKIGRIALEITRAADWELGRVLASLAYAAAIGDSESTMLVAGDPSILHAWGTDNADEGRRTRLAWEIPRETRDEVTGTGWHVEGSLLALDVGLATDALRRVSSDAPPSAPTISDNQRRAFTESVALANAFEYTDEDMALLAQALERGRERLAAATEASRLAAAADAAGLDCGRRALLAWAAVHEAEAVPRFFSLGDLLRLGQLDRASVRNLDAWGTSGLSYDGRLCLRFPVSQPAAALSGRLSLGLLPTLVPDLGLLVGDALYQRHLPAVLARSMLLVATPDYMDRLALAHEDDWLTLTGDAQRIVPSRIDDYLASVSTSGPLVPLREPNGGQRD